MAEPSSLLVTADITDELVGPVVTQPDLDDADEYLDDLIKSLDDDYSIDDVAATLPRKVKKLLIAYVCREICVKKTGAGSSAFRDQKAGDKWGDKLPYFQDRVRELEAQMSIELITGEIVASSPVGTINVERG